MAHALARPLARLIATFFFIGRLPLAPGTWGSAAAILPAWFLHMAGGFPLLALTTLALFLIGWWATAAVTCDSADKDPSEVVVDEVVGQWIALFPLSAGLWHAGVDPHIFPWPGWAGGFLLFRLFDIWKPWPVGWADRLGTPLGVMLDDVLAGLWAALLVGLAGAFAHGMI